MTFKLKVEANPEYNGGGGRSYYVLTCENCGEVVCVGYNEFSFSRVTNPVYAAIVHKCPPEQVTEEQWAEYVNV